MQCGKVQFLQMIIVINILFMENTEEVQESKDYITNILTERLLNFKTH